MPKDPVELTVKKIKVRVVGKRGPSCVVEYADDGSLKRAIVPNEAIEEDAIDAETLGMGIPYGLPWEQLITLSATPQALAEHLRANGIWTLADVEANPQAVYGAIQAVYGVDFGRLIQAAHNYKP